MVEFNSGNVERGICAIQDVRERDREVSYIPVKIIGKLSVSTGMSAGTMHSEARTQALPEIYERNIQGRITAKSICLPDIPEAVIARYPRITADVNALREASFGILVKDGSLRTFALFSFCTCFAGNRRQILSVIGVLAYLLRIAACVPRVSNSEAPVLNLPCA